MSFTRSAALISACAFASLAAADFTNIVPTFDPVGPGVTENPNVDGMAVVHFDEAAFQSSVALVAVGLVRATDYGVKVDSGLAGQSVAQAFTARTFLGVGIYSTTIPGDATFQTVIDIYRWDGDPDPFQVFEVSPTEERARGFGQNVN